LFALDSGFIVPHGTVLDVRLFFRARAWGRNSVNIAQLLKQLVCGLARHSVIVGNGLAALLPKILKKNGRETVKAHRSLHVRRSAKHPSEGAAEEETSFLFYVIIFFWFNILNRMALIRRLTHGRLY
jgi:hypothetical protein